MVQPQIGSLQWSITVPSASMNTTLKWMTVLPKVYPLTHPSGMVGVYLNLDTCSYKTSYRNNNYCQLMLIAMAQLWGEEGIPQLEEENVAIRETS